MEKRFIEAAGRVHAGPGLIQSTRLAVAATRRRRRAVRRVAAAAAAFLLLSGGGWVWFAPVSAVSIDAAQPVQLKLNRFDRVVSAEGEEVPLFSGCEAAVSRLLARMEADGAGELLVTVTGGDAELYEMVSECAAGHPNVYCDGGSAEEAAAADAAGLPLGKYRMLLALQALDPSVTAEEVAGMGMRQLREWEAALSGEADSAPGGGSGNGGGAGHHGRHAGNGQQKGRGNQCG